MPYRSGDVIGEMVGQRGFSASFFYVTKTTGPAGSGPANGKVHDNAQRDAGDEVEYQYLHRIDPKKVWTLPPYLYDGLYGFVVSLVADRS